MGVKKITTPLDKDTIKDLKAGEEVLLSGVIYTARDQVHQKICESGDNNDIIIKELIGQTIYYCGPTPSGDRVIGSCGPTTSSRMDQFTPKMLELGIKAMIGKGTRSGMVVEQIKKHKAVYFLAPAGTGAYLAGRVKACKPVAFQDLGPEAVYRLEVKDFPLVVGIDSEGDDVYKRLKAGKGE